MAKRERIDELFRITEESLEELFAGMLKYEASSNGKTTAGIDVVCRGVTHDILEHLKAHLRLGGLLREGDNE